MAKLQTVTATNIRRVKRINSHVGLFRFYRELSPRPIMEIERVESIPSPYAYSPTHLVYLWPAMKIPIFIVETSHKRYDVFTFDPQPKRNPVLETLGLGLATGLGFGSGLVIAKRATEHVMDKAARHRNPSATGKYDRTLITVDAAGPRRFRVRSGDGTGHSYTLERAIGKLTRRVGAIVERTGSGSIVYITFPWYSKATGASTDTITDKILAEWIAKS